MTTTWQRLLVDAIRRDPIKYVAGGSMAFMTAYRLDEYWINYVLGGCLSSFVVKFLKLAINAPRPASATKHDAGFPSSHSHNLAFLFTYSLLRDVVRQPKRAFLERPAFLSLCVLWTCVDRVSKGEHTVVQVLAGLLSGGSCGLLFDYYLFTLGGEDFMHDLLQRTNVWLVYVYLTVLAIVTVVGVAAFRRFKATT
jgi:hypothetical protein